MGFRHKKRNIGRTGCGARAYVRSMFPARLGVRTRILAIALIPSLTLLGLGMFTAGDLVRDSAQVRQWIDDLEQIRPAASELGAAAQVERMLSLRKLTTGEIVPELVSARARVDRGFEALVRADARRHEPSPYIPAAHAKFQETITKVRAGIDGRALSPVEVYQYFNGPFALFHTGFRRAQQVAPDPLFATRIAEAVRLLAATEAMSRGNAIGVALWGSDGRAFPLEDFTTQVGFYKAEITNLIAEFGEPRNRLLAEIVASGAWQQISTMEAALAERLASHERTRTPDLPLSLQQWQDAAAEVNTKLFAAYSEHLDRARGSAIEAARRTERSAWVAGAVVLVGSVVAMLIAVVLADRIIRRLRRLRDATLEVADTELPKAIRRAKAGERTELAPILDFGTDEIGEVATAFEQAATVAVGAAVEEARTREGVRSVFVNIAHRSQVVVHRQLEILDEAESKQQDPALLEVYFQLDHLATRARRNAENLLILGGSRPGRRWSTPVPLVDVLRSAVGETKEYVRVRVGGVPDARLYGAAVADLIHLIAEFVDNATAFSPPATMVEVSAGVVGKGLAVEVADQGIGLTEAEFERYNSLLAAPPDFGFAALSHDSRMGLFVVAQLASTHAVSVRLAESPYGGVRAIVVIPGTLIDGPEAAVAGERKVSR